MRFTLPASPGVKWNGFKPSNKKHTRLVKATLNEFMRAPMSFQKKVLARVPELQRQIVARAQEFTAKDATPDLFNNINVVDVIQTDVGDIDLGWGQAYGMVDLRDTQESSFEILGVSSGLSFRKVKPGGKADIYQVSGDKINVPVDLYGGGLGFDLTWWLDSKFYHVEEATADFRFKHYDEMAEVFYGLIIAVTTAITFDTDDVTTISKAVADILSSTFKTLPASPSSTFLVYFNPALQKRMFKALNSVIAYTGEKENRFNVVPVMSQYVTDTAHYWVVLPARKSKWGNRMDLTVLEQTNIDAFTHDAVGWSRYGGYLNGAQVRRCNLS